MTVSGSVPSDPRDKKIDRPQAPGLGRFIPSAAGAHVWLPLAIALTYLAAHLPSLAPTLEDIDSINFALGLHDYDPTNNQPHPPGYPVYIAFGRVSLALIDAIPSGVNIARTDALALAILSPSSAPSHWSPRPRSSKVLSKDSRNVSLWATALLAASPLFWLTGLRPMSDMPGLAFALVAQALLLRGMTDRAGSGGGRLRGGSCRRDEVPDGVADDAALRGGGGRAEAGRTALADLTSGRRTRRRSGHVARALDDRGGRHRQYVVALGLQAGDDFAAVDMLWATPTLRHLARALRDAFVLPWSRTSWPRSS